MNRKTILEKVQYVFRKVFDDEELVVSDNTTSDDIEDWDSISHVDIVENLQTEFGITFTSYEIGSWIDVGEMVDCIEKKLN